jgi:hypothetical protein
VASGQSFATSLRAITLGNGYVAKYHEKKMKSSRSLLRRIASLLRLKMVQMLPPQQERQYSSQSGSVRVERLEYGKLCVEPDGSILGTVEHRQLGWSELIPEKMLRFCLPSIIGISSSDFEELPEDCRHGTVLRPVLLSDDHQAINIGRPLLSQREIVLAMCRVTTRPEDGKYGSGRRYTMARYVLSLSNLLEPQRLLAAMESLPMQGITPQQVLDPLPCLWAPLLPLPVLDELTKLFLREAVIYVLSGISVSIVGHVSEEVFFKWVAGLWCLLPPSLRPHLSAGWGVGASLSGKLSISYARQRANTCAAFYPEEGRWSAPLQVVYLEKEKLVRRSFFVGRVHPGLYYTWFIFGCQPGKLPEINDLSVGQEAEALVNMPPLDNYPSGTIVPDFDDPITTGVFRFPGWSAYNTYLLQQLEDYIAGQNPSDLPGFSPDMSGLTYRERKREAFKVVAESLGDLQKQARADNVVWSMLNFHGSALFSKIIAQLQGPGSARLRLMAAVHGGKHTSLLKALRRAARDDESNDLVGELKKALNNLLDNSLKPDSDYERRLMLHEQLLLKKHLPDAYAEWAIANDFKLALALLGRTDNDRMAAFGRLQDLVSQSPHSNQHFYLRTLWRWSQGASPSDNDRTNIANLPDHLRIDFGNKLREKWKLADSAQAREKILSWLELAPPERLDDPLLVVYFGGTIYPDKVLYIADEVEEDRVPASLLPKIAELTLMLFIYLAGRLLKRADRWNNVIKFWPEEILYALWPLNLLPTRAINDRTQATNSDAIMNAAEQLEMSTGQLEMLIKSWLSSQREIRFNVSRWQWLWVKKSRQIAAPADTTPSTTPLVNLCKYLSMGSKLIDDTQIEESDMKKAIKFVGWADAYPEMIQQSRLLWNSEREGFYLRLLLQFFPDEEFKPTPTQLGALINYKEWLKGHLNKYPNKEAWFLVATRKPLSVTYPRSDDGKICWKDAYSASPIWAVFWAVPINKQGSLRDAIKAHCGDNIDKSADMCRRYLNGHRSNEYHAALDRVVLDYVVPSLRSSYEDEEIEQFLSKGPPEGYDKDDRFWGLVQMLSKDDYTKKVLKKLPV